VQRVQFVGGFLPQMATGYIVAWTGIMCAFPAGELRLPRNNDIPRPGLSPFVSRCLDALPGSLQITMPHSGFGFWQIGFSQSIGQIAANTNFFAFRHKARDRFTVLEGHEGNVLTVRATDGVRRIARTFRDGYARFLHSLIIRLSAFLTVSTCWLSGNPRDGVASEPAAMSAETNLDGC